MDFGKRTIALAMQNDEEGGRPFAKPTPSAACQLNSSLIHRR